MAGVPDGAERERLLAERGRQLMRVAIALAGDRESLRRWLPIVEADQSDDVLPDVEARLRAGGIAVEEFSLHLPSLDEVFFTLTGTRSRDNDEKALV